MAYITTNGRIILSSGSIEQHDTPDIVVSGSYSVRAAIWNVALKIQPAGSGALDAYRDFQIQYTKAEIDAYTGTGTGDTAKIQNALEQAVKATLLALNASITFTIV